MKTSHNHLFIFAVLGQFLLNLPAQANALSFSAPDWPPFYISKPAHNKDLYTQPGFATEIITLCSQKSNFQVLLKELPIKRMFREMDSGDLDLNIMSFKADRTKSLNFGKEVVFTNTYGLWTRSGLSINVQTLSQLDGLNIVDLVGIRTSDAYRSYIDQRLSKNGSGRVTVVSSVEAIAKMLAIGRADAAVVSIPEMKFRLQKLGLSHRVTNVGFVIKSQPYYFVASKASKNLLTSPGILDRLDQCIRTIKRDGTWEKLKTSYDL